MFNWFLYLDERVSVTLYHLGIFNNFPEQWKESKYHKMCQKYRGAFGAEILIFYLFHFLPFFFRIPKEWWSGRETSNQLHAALYYQ